ncbi:hypothetical protein [Hyalangium gracile]|uniref:hypothetical protein n=1 Tax=Hyalangium gracile TaxID=394092 RepID=UPI001CC9734C|nr:hypothetical protein [Hyalangium gracile]
MQTASEANIVPDALRLNAPLPVSLVSELPSSSELPERPQALRPTRRSRAEDIEDFESMWDIPVRSW